MSPNRGLRVIQDLKCPLGSHSSGGHYLRARRAQVATYGFWHSVMYTGQRGRLNRYKYNPVQQYEPHPDGSSTGHLQREIALTT